MRHSSGGACGGIFTTHESFKKLFQFAQPFLDVVRAWIPVIYPIRSGVVHDGGRVEGSLARIPVNLALLACGILSK